NQIVEIRDVIKNLGKNKTVLFSSHILQEVESICDRLVIINKGTIVADDTLANLREQQNSFTIVAVEFAEKVNEEILATIDGVLHMEKVKPSLFRLHTNNPDLLKKELLSYSIQNNLNIISLQSETKSLENVFRHLTGNIQNN
ncbi:MAG: gliding motility-associated ABC transporter ATP-binding subunit GldA, partial [Panacibacter sp.]